MSDFFCPLPWIHQFIQSNSVKCCCSSSVALPLTSQEFAQSKFIAEVKDSLAQGKAHSSCQSCVEQERNGFVSTRQLALKDWVYTAKTVPDRLEYLDLRQHNQCNFSCRSCTPLYSTQIKRELEQHPSLSKYYPQVSNNSIEQDIDLDHVRVINFTGGEPLLIKQHLDILEQLISKGKTDTKILVTTNASIINPRIISLFEKFDDVHYTISLDAIGHAAEYIRHGTDWSVVDNNVHYFCGTTASVSINCTISAYSVLCIDQLVKYFAKLRVQYPNRPLELMFAVVQYPNFLNPLVLPNTLRERAIASLEQAFGLLTPIKTNPIEHLNTLNNLRDSLKSATMNALTTKFIEFTNVTDQVRNENFSTTFNLTL